MNYYRKDAPKIMFELSGDHLTREMILTISFLMWKAGIYCTQKIFLDFCSLPEREERGIENTVTITKVLSLRFPWLCC